MVRPGNNISNIFNRHIQEKMRVSIWKQISSQFEVWIWYRLWEPIMRQSLLGFERAIESRLRN